MVEPISATEPEERPRFYGIRKSDLSLELLTEVMTAYDEMVGSNSVRQSSPSDVLRKTLDMLRRGGYADWRFGSRITSESKLIIERVRPLDSTGDVVGFAFDLNVSRKHPSWDKTIELQEDFRHKASRIVENTGIGVELPRI